MRRGRGDTGLLRSRPAGPAGGLRRFAARVGVAAEGLVAPCRPEGGRLPVTGSGKAVARWSPSPRRRCCLRGGPALPAAAAAGTGRGCCRFSSLAAYRNVPAVPGGLTDLR